MDSINPATLEGEDFHNWIARHLQYRNDWSALLVSDHIQRTLHSVEGLLDTLREQLARYAGNDANWTQRTTSMKKMAEGRLRQIDRHLNGTGNGRQLSEWKEFAASLCEIIEDSDLSDELDAEMIPVGGLTAREWLNRRREKRGETVLDAIRTGSVDEFMVAGRER